VVCDYRQSDIYRVDVAMAGKELGRRQHASVLARNNLTSLRTVTEKSETSTGPSQALLREEGARNIAAVDLSLCFIKKLLCWCVYYELARAFSSSIAAYLFHVRFWTLARLGVCGTEF
jgi:hypothetical protein